MSSGISVVINTFNEELHIARAIKSVASWAEEIIVVDMFSSDRTVDIAQDLGAKVLMHEPVGYVEPAREFAVASASQSWVLILDADELISKKLAETLIELTQKSSDDAYMLPRLNYFFGDPLMHTGWGPDQDRQLRFFKSGRVKFSKEIHSIPDLKHGATLGVLDFAKSGGIVHFNYVTFSQFVTKLNAYTDIEAAQLVAANKRISPCSALTAMCKEFFLRYFLRQGFRDGWRGFYLSTTMMFYRLLAYGKANALFNEKNKDKVLQEYVCISKGYIEEFRN